MEALRNLSPSTELWLIQVPASMDVQCLDGVRVRSGKAKDGRLRMHSPAGNFVWADLQQHAPNVCLVPDAGHGEDGAREASTCRLRAAPAFARHISVYCADEVGGAASTDGTLAPARAPVAQPEGMRVRFRPIGDTVRNIPAAVARADDAARKRKKKRKEERALSAPPEAGAAGGAQSSHPPVDVERSGEKKKTKKREKSERPEAPGGAPPAGEETAEEREKRKQQKREAKREARRLAGAVAA